MTNLPLHARPSRRLESIPRLASAAVLSLTLTLAAWAADADRKPYDLPAGDAASTLKQFSAQSGEQIVYPVAQVTGLKTNAVSGDLTAREALERMVAGTDLQVVQDEKTGALGLKRAAGPNGLGAAQDSGRPGQVEPALIKLAEYTVLGSRIRQSDVTGPSPVSTYNNDYIRESGAMTLADFMNRIPQNYSGIASGRSSAPNELNPDFGQRTESSSGAFNFVLGAADSPPAQTGVSGVNLRGLGSASTLVLVDGRRAAQSGNGNRGTDTRQGFVDLNTIPLSMIDHIEVTTDGASAIYGADAVAGVINIVLKKNYTGSELSAGYKATEHGGGRERNVALFSGFAHGKLSGTISVEYFDRQDLKASDRSFSKNQDHTGIAAGTLTATGATKYGVDYRLNWGYPAVVQASGGTVSGQFNAIPGVRVVAVPVGATATPAVSAFIPITTPAGTATIVNASGQRRMNTASFLDLVPESKRTGAYGTLKYEFNERLQAYATYRSSINRSNFSTQPTTSITGGFGSAVLLPAAYNPFNQNVTIGMILYDWGSTQQKVRTIDNAFSGGLLGKFGKTWEWDLGFGWEAQNLLQLTRNFNGPGFAGLLTAADPAQRFNPFIDATAPGAPSQAALLETLSVYPSLDSTSRLVSIDFSANGDLYSLPGGEIKAAFGGSRSRASVDSLSINYSSSVTPVASRSNVAGGQLSKAVFGELSIPVFGKPNAQAMLHRLDVQLAGRYETDGPFSKGVPKYGALWSPFDSLLVRGSWSQGFRAPGVTEYLTSTSSSTGSVSDPRRTPTTTTGVVITTGSNPDPKSELSDNSTIGVVYEPTFIKGLTLESNYYETKQKNVLQLLSAQTIVNNESLFPDRVIRAPATSADIALNQPGQITAINRVFVNFGTVVNRSMDYNLDYRLPWDQLGRWHLNVGASHTLEDYRAVAPGQPAVILENDTGSPPKWTYNASLFWHAGSWDASVFAWYLDGFTSNNAGNAFVANSSSVVFYPTPSVTKIDFRLGYEFKQGVWRGHGKGLRVLASVDNAFDKKPPFSDTVWGYNAGLHSVLVAGRTYGFQITIPLN
ncbi:MAG: TonB-dependent receptor [Verrucomicrobia bacterium]|nr:TonB-dependent receptor [Verrucomicrobiota bacterium]